MSSSSHPRTLPLGHTFHGRYQVLRCIRAGGMGVVYEVLELATRRRRALKVICPDATLDADLRSRFALEAIVTADVHSEHVVETFDAGVDGETGAAFLVMELLRGEDLGAVLARRGPLPAGEVVEIVRQVALALERTHAAGVVHRDLKPENLFLTRRDDGSPWVKVLDFGVAKLVAPGGAGGATTRSVGTPLYMSPEQIRGDGAIGPASDLYALGQIAYTLLAGEAYWAAEHRAGGVYPLLIAALGGARETASERAAALGVTLPPAFDAWFARATAPEPGDRPAAAAALSRGLGAALGLAAPDEAMPELLPIESVTAARDLLGVGRAAALAPGRDEVRSAGALRRRAGYAGAAAAVAAMVAVGAVALAPSRAASSGSPSPPATGQPEAAPRAPPRAIAAAELEAAAPAGAEPATGEAAAPIVHRPRSPARAPRPDPPAPAAPRPPARPYDPTDVR